MLSQDSIRGWLGKAAVLVLVLFAGAIALSAQTAGSYVPSLVVSSTNAITASGLPGSLGDVALDACGNVYAVDQGSGQVVEVPSGGGAASTVLAAASYGTASLWIDAAKANLFVLQGYAGHVTQIPLAGCAANTSAQTSISIGNLGAVSWYWGGSAEATDSTDNLFIATNYACCGASPNELLEEYASGTYTVGTTLLSGLANPITSIAVDSSGNIYYVSGGALYELPVTTAATSSSPAAYSATPAAFGSGYNKVVGVAIDSAGNLYVADGGASTLFEIPYETTSSGSALNPSDQFIVATGLAISNTPAIGANGAVYFADQGSSVYALTRFSAAAGQVAVGSSGTTTLDAVFNSALTPGALTIYPNAGPFTQTGGTCVAGNAYAAGSSCTMTLRFSPAAPGTSSAAATLLSPGGTSLATIYLSGEGTGPGLTLDPGVVTAMGSGFKSPESVAIDAAGDIFYADAGNNAVFEFTPGSSSAISIGTGLSKPAGVAVDGAGNVLIADTGNNRIVEVPMVNGALSNSAQVTLVAAENSSGAATPIAGAALSAPASIAVDGAGNLFIADTGNNRVVAIPYSNGSWNLSAAAVAASSLSGPLAVTVDSTGNLYVANSGVGQIDEVFYPLTQPTLQLVAVGFGNPTGLALDASGSLFVADNADGAVERIPNVSGSLDPNDAVEAGIGINAPYGVAVDPSGNLYVSDNTAGAAYEVSRTSATLSFGDWAVNSTSGVLAAQVENEGNMPLTLATPYYTPSGNTADFSVSTTGSGICSSGASVAAGANCELDATFTPTAQGARSETLALASNATNGSAQLTLAGNGSVTAATATNLTMTSPASGTPSFGQAITLTAEVTASSGTPTGDVTLLVDGVQTGVASLNTSGVATFQLASGLTGGSHSLIAIYGGTSAFNGSVSSALTIAVTKAPTVTALTVVPPYINPLSADSGNTVNLTAAISFTGVGIPTGTVTFTSNGTTLGVAPLLPVAGGLFEANFSTTALPVGSNAIVATYSGDPNYIGSVSSSTTVTVVSAAQLNISPSGTSVTSSANGNGTITFTATSYGGWSGLVGFSCLASSLPANARCVFSPGQIEVVPNTPGASAPNPTVTLAVAIDQPPQTPTANGFFWWLAAPVGLLLFFARRRFARHAFAPIAMAIAVLLLGISTLGLGACSSGNLFVTPKGTQTVTVYAWTDPFSSPPSSSNSNPTAEACGINPTTNEHDPTLAPCAQIAFPVTVTVQ